MTGAGAARGAVCCDLDGVVWRGSDPVPGAPGAIASLRAAGFRVGFLTNNSFRRVGEVIDALDAVGIPAEPEDVMTSALAAADLLSAGTERGADVLVCAGPGVVEALTEAGFAVVREGPAAAVVVGWHRDFDFDGLDRAAAAVRGGARLIATNLDATYPEAGGVVPGAGAIVAAVATAGGRAPEVAGKPSPVTAAMVRRRLGDRGIVVGDRPSTDGALADALGWPFALVLSGVTSRPGEPGGEAVPVPPPAYVADDLARLAPALIAPG